jgi:hypothetical protein
MTEQPSEPSLRADPSPPEERVLEGFERVESLLTSAITFFLIGFVVIALVAVIAEVKDPLLVDHDFTAATIKGINATFLAIILLELLHTTTSRGPISLQLQEFVVIGITVTVRHGLEVAAAGGDPRNVVVNLAINALATLLLVAAFWLVRQQLRADRREGALERTAAPPSRSAGTPGADTPRSWGGAPPTSEKGRRRGLRSLLSTHG